MVYKILTQQDTKFVQQIQVLNLEDTYLLDDFEKYSHLLLSERSLLIKAFLLCVNRNLLLKKPQYTLHLSSLIGSLFHLAKKTKKIFLDLAINTIPEDLNLLPWMEYILKYTTSRYKQQLELLSHYMNNYILPEFKKLPKSNHKTPHASLLQDYIKKCIVHSDPIVRTLGKDLFLLLSQQEQHVFENNLDGILKKRLSILIKPSSKPPVLLKSVHNSPASVNITEVTQLLYQLDTNHRLRALKSISALPFDSMDQSLLKILYSKLVLVTNIATTLVKIENALPMSICISILVEQKRWMRIKHVIKWEQVDVAMLHQWNDKIFNYVPYKQTAPEHLVPVIDSILNPSLLELETPVKRSVPFTPQKTKKPKILKADSKDVFDQQNDKEDIEPIEETSVIFQDMKIKEDLEELVETEEIFREIQAPIKATPLKTPYKTPLKHTPFKTPNKLATPHFSPMVLDTPVAQPICDTFESYFKLYSQQCNLSQLFLMIIQGSVCCVQDIMDHFSDDPKQLYIAAILDGIDYAIDTEQHLIKLLSLLNWCLTIKRAISFNICQSVLVNISKIYNHTGFFSNFAHILDYCKLILVNIKGSIQPDMINEDIENNSICWILNTLEMDPYVFTKEQLERMVDLMLQSILKDYVVGKHLLKKWDDPMVWSIIKSRLNGQELDCMLNLFLSIVE